VVAIQATRSHQVAEVVVFSNDFARRRGASGAAVGDLDPPGVPDGPEDRQFIVPPGPVDLKVVVSAECASSSRSEPTVHQDQLKPVSNALPGQVLQNQLAGPVLVR
jgi:hypothetical protein